MSEAQAFVLPPQPVTIIPIVGMPEITRGADLAGLLVETAATAGIDFEDDDVVIVSQKIVSKAEGRVVEISLLDEEARRQIAEKEAKRVVRRRRGLLIAETHQGFICANAGVDASNVEPGKVSLLPIDPDKSARRLRQRLRRLTGRALAVIISDTFGRAWRVGQTNVAIGVAGMVPLIDYRNTSDHFGNPLRVTMIAVADEIAAAAELVMGKAEQVPAAIARGVRFPKGRGAAKALVRKPEDDLFR